MNTICELLQELRTQHALLVTAESLTGGLIAAHITEIPGASDVFWGGIVAYSLAAKSQLLGVAPQLLQEYGAVSAETAAAMAAGAVAAVQVSAIPVYALAVTGLAGPGGGSERIPVGTVYIAAEALVDGRRCTLCERFLFAGNRSDIRNRTLSMGVTMLSRLLDKIKMKEVK